MAADATGLGARVRAIGRDAGLDAVGIAGADPFTAARDAIEARRSDGRAAGMQFVFRNPARSTDPRATLPGAQAVVVGARRYVRTDPAAPAGPAADPVAAGVTAPTARVARYSWIDHYEPLRAGLEQIADQLRVEGWQARVLVDDNALVDRAAAYRAGLGWYGTNTTLLLPGAGSWFVLGSVLTDAPLDPDPGPVADGCGTCRRCVPACPTGALAADAGPGGSLDARRCLAWLVQAEGMFPAEHRVALGDRLYGCDECQEVCPVNRVALRRRPPPPAEAGAQARVDVLAILAASDEELLGAFGRWYIPRRQPRYLRRNALVVLGNVGRSDDPVARVAVARALADDDPLLRAHAVWAADRLGHGALLGALAGDTDPDVQVELARVGNR